MSNNNSLPHNHNHSHNTFDNPEMFAQKFDGSERDEWQKPNEVIKSLNLSSSAVVVEIGAGTGYFTVRLAEHLKDGKVITLDTAPKMAEYLKKRVMGAGLSNVDVRLSEDNAEIPLEEKVDLVMCVDAYHHITDRVSYFSHLIQYLKQGGKIIIIDRSTNSPESPPSSHRTPPELVKKEMMLAGLELVQELDFLLPYQFYLAFNPTGLKKKI